MRKVIYLISVLFCVVLGVTCDGPPGETPLDGKLGICFHGSPPSSYNCNWDSRFEVNLDPWVDASLTEGYLRIWFELWQGDESKYRSNYMDLALGAASYYTLEFGGEIEGYYKIIGGLAYYPGEGEPSSAKVNTKDDNSITATPKSYFTNTMHIEYDYQYSYGLGSRTFKELTSAFHVADTDTDFLWDEEDMTPEQIDWDNLGIYHAQHWSGTSGYNMHLLAIKGLTNNQDSTLGASSSSPGPYSYSFVFVEDVFNFVPYGYETDALCKVTIHELGHQRAGLRHASGEDAHPEDHDSPFCVMNQGIYFEGNNDNDPHNDPAGLGRWLIQNPHFCDMCIDSLKKVDW